MTREWDVRGIVPGTPEYAQARDVRYDALYGHLRLPRHLIEDTDGRTYVHRAVFDGDRVVGYGRIHLEDGESKVYQVCVAETHRGRGIAAALMEDLMRVARDAGRAEVVLDARVEAVGFYERLGFVAEGDEFLSGRTNTPHRAMRRRLRQTGAVDGPIDGPGRVRTPSQ